MADPYEVDDQGTPVVEADAVPPADPAVQEALRRQVDATLRFMRRSTVIGVVIIAILAVVLSGVRGVMILVGLVYLVTSITAYWYLRRTLDARIKRTGVPPA